MAARTEHRIQEEDLIVVKKRADLPITVQNALFDPSVKGWST